MKRNKLLNGGRPRTLDDLAVLDEQIRDLEMFFGDLGNFLAAGVQVSGNDISAGYVYLSGRILKVDAYTAPSFPVYIYAAAPVDLAAKAYENGEVKPTQIEYKAAYSTTTPTTPYIIVGQSGGRRLADALGINTKAESLQVSQLAATVSRKMDDLPPGILLPYGGDMALIGADGLGTGKLIGYALADGRNGTYDMRRRFVIGYQPDGAAEPADTTGTPLNNYGRVGNTGGEERVSLTVQQLPSFKLKTNLYRNSQDYVDGSAGANNIGTIPNSQPIETEAVGAGHQHENRPPYIVLAWIQKLR